MTCVDFRIVTGKPNLEANFLQQTSLMLAMALGIESQCGASVVASTDPAYFHCWDMASPESLSPGGDFVPDGEVNVLDYGRQVRLQAIPGLGRGTAMLLSEAGRLQYPNGAADCASRRSLAAGIATSWAVSCPPSLASDACYYDCNGAPSCMHSIAPSPIATLSTGVWWRVQLPADWTAFSLLFETGVLQCADSVSPYGGTAPSQGCVQLQSNSSCDNENFAVSRQSGLAIAAPTAGSQKCPSNSRVHFFVPAVSSQGLNYRRPKPGGSFPGTWVETASGILHLLEWLVA